MGYKLKYTHRADKDARLLERAGLDETAKKLLVIVRNNPFQNPPEYEKLKGYQSVYSRRINKQHRFVYEVLPNSENHTDANGEPYSGVVKIIRMWTHYE